jgi:predicted enzyme related to lactoylglutathione lyase
VDLSNVRIISDDELTGKENTMISGGNITIYVSDFDSAVRFYTDALGLKLTNRFSRQWATIDAGPSYWTTDDVGAGLVIGLQPASAKHPAPGTRGAVGFGIETYEPIEGVMAKLAQRKVQITGEVIRFEAGNTVSFEDSEGTPTYLHEFPPEMVQGSDAPAPEAGEQAAMLSGGHALVYVSNMDAAIRFYTGALGLKLTNRFEAKFATVEAGRNLVVGLHPQTPRSPVPGSKGSVSLGLTLDEPIEAVLPRLARLGVRLASDPVRSALGTMAAIEDPDGNSLYLWEDDAELLQPADHWVESSTVR